MTTDTPDPTTELVHTTTPMDLILAGQESGMTPEVMTGYFDLQERWENNQAAKEHAAAMVLFQSKCPQIHKGRQVPGMGAFASYDDIKKVIQPLLTEFGISLGYSFDLTDGLMVATCTVTVGSHSTNHTMPVPLPKSMGQINDSQKSGVAMSYGKRYSMTAALDIVVTDEDTDAGGLGETITEDQAIVLAEMIEPLGSAQLARLLEWVGVERLADFPASKHGEAVDGIKRRLKEQEGKA